MSAPRLSLCMIVRDNIHTLGPCLEGIRPWVDEMIVVDTGSKDGTAELAASLGAKVSHFPWCDDFSAARNESLRLATGDWLFWMDSDDSIDAANGEALRRLALGVHDPRILGYVAQVHCPGPGGDKTIVDHVKLVRNHPAIRFEFRIHEQLLPSIRRLGGEVGWTDIFVVHSGSDQSPEGRVRKQERDLRILALELAERPDHSFALFNIGMTHNDMGRHEEAVEALIRSVDLSDPGESQLRKAYALLVASLTALSRNQEARERGARGLEFFPGDPELHFRLGQLAHDAGDFAEAERHYRAALKAPTERRFSSLDPGIMGHKARHNLGLVMVDAGRPDLAEAQFREALREAPRHSPTRRALAEALIAQGRLAAARHEIDRLAPDCDEGSPVVDMLRAKALARRGPGEEADGAFEALERRFPEHLEVLEAAGQFRFERGHDDEAQRLLERQAGLDPMNAAVRHNLGALLARGGKSREARAWIKESLRLRPGHGPTLALLDATPHEEPSEEARKVLPSTAPPCHSRLPWDESRGEHFCSHPKVIVPLSIVRDTDCVACNHRLCPPPERPRRHPDSGERILGASCYFLGGQCGTRPCPTCRGHVELKEFRCSHPSHRVTTMLECDLCPDFARPLSIGGVREWGVCVLGGEQESAARMLAERGWINHVLFGRQHDPSTARDDCSDWLVALAEIYLRFPRADAYLMVPNLNESIPSREELESLLWPDQHSSILTLVGERDSDDTWAERALVLSPQAAIAIMCDSQVMSHGRVLPGYSPGLASMLTLWAARREWRIEALRCGKNTETQVESPP